MATHNSRAVMKCSATGKKLKTYPSIKIAANDCNIPAQNINAVCKENRKTAGGYTWKYDENFSKEDYHKHFRDKGGKVHPEYSSYYVFSDGKIFSTKGNRYLKQTQNSQGYLRVGVLDKKGKRWSIYVHRIVAQCFIPNPDNKPIVNHMDGNVKNNNIENLEWVTDKESMNHAIREGIKARGFKPVEQYSKEGKLMVTYPSLQEAAKALNVSRGSVCDACRGKYKTCRGYTLKYAGGIRSKDNADEIWIKIKEMDGYEASNLGRIYSTKTHRVLKPCVRMYGRKNVTLCGKSYLVHRLVASAFIPRPKDCKGEVFHKDKNQRNNCVENLEWR